MGLPATVSVICASCCVDTHVRMSLSTFSMLLSFATCNASPVSARLDNRGTERKGNGWELVAILGY